jgi:hypothetical protein
MLTSWEETAQLKTGSPLVKDMLAGAGAVLVPVRLEALSVETIPFTSSVSMKRSPVVSLATVTVA